MDNIVEIKRIAKEYKKLVDGEYLIVTPELAHECELIADRSCKNCKYYKNHLLACRSCWRYEPLSDNWESKE